MAHRIIDVALLRSLKACKSHVDRFHAAWPAGVVVPTSEDGIAEIAEQASKVGLDFEWAAEALLSPRGFRAYSEAIKPARKTWFNDVSSGVRPPVDFYRENTTYDKARATELLRLLMLEAKGEGSK